MSDVGSAITSQTDLLWTLALAVIGFEVLLARNWANGCWRIRGPISGVLLLGSMAAFAYSMVQGYFTYGAVVELIMPGLSEEDISARFQTAGDAAFHQLAGFALGLALFLILFIVNPKAVSAGDPNA